MKMSGQEKIAASRETVWAALNDAEILKKSITGCKSLEKTSETEFSATVQAKVGPVKATFNGDVKLSKLNPPKSYVLSGQGKGGVAGFAKGKATVKLEEDGEATLLNYDVDAQVGGKLAQIGSRLIDSTAKKMANDFFKKFAKLAAASGTRPTAKTPAKKAAKKLAKKVIKKPAKKGAQKSTAKSSAVVETKTSATSSTSAPQPVTVEKNAGLPTHEKPSMLVPLLLAALGGAILLFFYLLFARP